MSLEQFPFSAVTLTDKD